MINSLIMNCNKILLFISFLIVVHTSFGQSVSGGCNSVYIGTACSYTISPPAGEDVTSYRLDGFPQSASVTRNSTANTKTYTTTWSSEGTYSLCLRESGGPCLRTVTINVYAKVGAVTLTGLAGNQCQSVTTTTYSASASNADRYSWSLSTVAAGSISSSGVVSWNTSFTGSVRVNVQAFDKKGGSTSASVNVVREANQTFSASMNAPSVVCEGNPFTIGVITSHSQASFEWYEDDSQNSIGSSASLPVTPQVGTFYRVVVTPSSSISCLTNSGSIRLSTRAVAFRVKPKVHSLTLSSPIAARCNDDFSTTTLIANASEVDSYQWSISPENAGQLDISGYYENGVRKSSCSVTWNNEVTGLVSISVSALGCGGSTKTVTKNIRVTKLPSAQSLTDLPIEICVGASQVVNLTSSEPGVNYELMVSGEQSGVIQKLSQTSWEITGPGSYAVVASDLHDDCPNVSSLAQIASQTQSVFNITNSTGTLIKKYWNFELEGCLFSPIQLTLSGNSQSYKWYLVNDSDDVCGCLARNNCQEYWGDLSPQNIQSKWDNFCLDFQKEGPNATINPGWVRKLLIRYNDVCDVVREEAIVVKALPGIFMEGITPEIHDRVQSAGNTQFEIHYQGTLGGLEWSITPAEAGTISPEGLVNWNPSWNSFLGDSKQPAIVKAKVKDCSGWENYPIYIDVYPVIDKDENRILSFTAKRAFFQDSDLMNNINSPDEVDVSAGFFDGLGRNVQNVDYFGATGSRDIIELRLYDDLGRESIKKLPYAGDHTLAYRSLAIDEQRNFYQLPPANIASDPTPHSQTIFEPSPLNRVIKQGAPGLAWQPDPEDNSYTSIDHTVKYSYEFNQENEVLQWTFTYPTEEYSTTALNAFGKVEAGTAAAIVFFPANQLYKNKTKDEQGNQVIEYVDKEGRTLLKRVQVVTGNPSTTDTNRDTNWASTYYIYDDFGNLVCVIPPEPSKRLTTQYFQAGSTETTKNNFLKRWAFRYRYDGRKRMIMKQVPGAEPVYMVYDNRDRLVMTQDGNQRSSTGRPWTFTKYDALNRPIATGLKDTTVGVLLTQAQMQALVDNFYTKASSKYYEVFIGTAAGNLHGYSNKSFPTTQSAYGASVGSPNENYFLTITYYDDYTATTNWGSDYQYSDLNLQATANGINYPQPDSPNNRVKGQVTATKVKVLDGGTTGGPTWFKSINYYDDKYRVIQNISDNYKGGIDRLTNLIDFSGKVLLTNTEHITRDIAWKDISNLELIGNKIVSSPTKVNAWGNGGAASTEQLPAGQNGWIEFTVFQGWGNIVLGLSDQNVDNNHNTIDYGIYFGGASVVRPYENGVAKSHSPYGIKAGDILKIERLGTQIRYYQNGILLYTSTIPSTTSLVADIAIFDKNLAVSNVRTSFSQKVNSIKRRFDYDHAGRLINTWHKFNDQLEILLAHNEYNELGQLIDKKLHVSSPVGGGQEVAKQSVDYAYNIRGWLTHINDAALTPQAGESKDYFGMELAYNTDLGTGNPSDKLQFNGNINAMKWSNNQGLGDQKENAYNFTYDPLNRLKTADFRQKDVSNWGLAKHRAVNGTIQSVDAFKEHISSYDLNGNIEQLQRSGQDGSLIDNLTYTYVNSNRLTKVTDAANDMEGFKEINTVNLDDYLYDSNGNLIQDRNKPSEEAVRNGSFDNGSDQWQLTEPGRLTFANGRVTITAGTSIALIDQSTPLRSSTPYLIFIEMVRTSATGTVKVLAGSNTGASYSATGNGYTTTGSLDRVGLEISPDFEGYIESISVRAFALITYNYLNLPERVIKGEGESMQYIYTATGQKLAQVVTEGTKTKTTDYVGEYVYENDTLLFVNHEEGRISLSSASPLSSGEGQGGEAQAEYQYHLKDHLGNVRLTFTTKEETEATLATLETTNENEERGNFLKYDDIRKVNSRLFDHTHAPGVGSTHYAMRLSGTPQETYGLARSIAVMPGDVISAEVFAKYVDLNDPNVETFLENLAASIAAGTTSPGVVIDGGNFGTPAALTMPFGTILNKSSETAGTPKAYLNWIVLDKNFRAILSKSGYRRVTTAASENGSLDPTNGLAAEGFPHERLFTPTIEVTEPGYVYIYLSNEEAGTDVYFDDFKVTHTKSPVIQSDDYYPFGLTFNSHSRENSVAQDYKFSSKEEQTELGLGWLDFGRRMYQPEIGRFMVQDRFADKYHSMTPYQYAANNPILYVDVNGDSIILSDAFKNDKVAMGIYNKWSQTDAGKAFLKNYGEGGKHEDVAVVFDVAVLTPCTRGETGAYAVDKKTGAEKNLADQKTIDDKKERGGNVSGMKSTLGKGEYLKFKLTIDKVKDTEEYVKLNRQETLTHESQHVILGTMDIKKDGTINWSGKDQHTIMKTNEALIIQRFNTLKSARPDLSDDKIRKSVLSFEN